MSKFVISYNVTQLSQRMLFIQAKNLPCNISNVSSICFSSAVSSGSCPHLQAGGQGSVDLLASSPYLLFCPHLLHPQRQRGLTWLYKSHHTRLKAIAAFLYGLVRAEHTSGRVRLKSISLVCSRELLLAAARGSMAQLSFPQSYSNGPLLIRPCWAESSCFLFT